jgi:hypothetical protein
VYEQTWQGGDGHVVLVTNDTGEFQRVDSLVLEDWAA